MKTTIDSVPHRLFDMFGNTDSLNEDEADVNYAPVFSDNSDGTPAAITRQPFANDERTTGAVRRPIPISTIDWRSTSETQYIPLQGIDILRGADQLYIQQSVELNDLISGEDSENRYIIKVPHGETLFYASETSTKQQQMCCGSNRAFVMKLYDQTQQEALRLERRLGCGMCSIWCYLQQVEVFTPTGFIGRIKQDFSIGAASFSIYKNPGDLIYKISGPGFATGKNGHFKIYSGDGLTQLGSYNNQWDQVENAYNLSVQFPSRRDETVNKALLLAAAFLLEYMYFLNSKLCGCCC